MEIYGGGIYLHVATEHLNFNCFCRFNVLGIIMDGFLIINRDFADRKRMNILGLLIIMKCLNL